jgi:hypothetical protein
MTALFLSQPVPNQRKAKAAYQDFLTLWKHADRRPHSEASENRVREAAVGRNNSQIAFPG